MIQLLTLDTWTDDIARWVIGTYNFDEKTIEDGVFYYCLFFVGFIGIGVFVFWSLGCSPASAFLCRCLSFCYNMVNQASCIYLSLNPKP